MPKSTDPILPFVVAAAAAAAFLSFCTPDRAHAQSLPNMQASNGKETVTLFHEQRICQGPARFAEYSDGKIKVSGCWVISQGMVLISYLDGDRADISVASFKPVEGV